MNEMLLVWVGRRAPGPWEEIARGYRERLARMTRFSEIRLRPATGRAGDVGRALGIEAAAIANVIRENDLLVVLDETGQRFTSKELAGWLSRHRSLGRVVLVVGSDLGLDQAVRDRARLLLSLSPMTLSHGLARVVVLEQLYRSLDMLAGGGYHRGGDAES